MPQFKIGDIVARKSYNYDVVFKIINIKGDMVDLVGITVRILADAPIYDLKYITKEEADRIATINDVKYSQRVSRSCSGIKSRFNLRNNSMQNITSPQIPIYSKESIYKRPGIVLHIDGEARYINNND